MVADVTLPHMNAMKIRKRGTSISISDRSSVSECTARKDSLHEFSRPLPNDPLMRRRSTLKNVAQGISGMLKLRNLTIPRSDTGKPKITLENTYKMAPEAGNHIAMSIIEEMAEKILRDEIGGKKYTSFHAGEMACSISSKIKTKVKEMNVPRFKIVCQVVITQAKEQGLEAASRCLWDASTDNFTAVTFQNNYIAATAMVYGVYFE